MALLKLHAGPYASEIDLKEFLQQREELSKDKISHFASEAEMAVSTHPDTIDRIKNIEKFYKSSRYRSLVGEAS